MNGSRPDCVGSISRPSHGGRAAARGGVGRGSSRSRRWIAPLLLAGLIGLARDAAAHDWWLETQPPAPKVGESVAISMHVGVGFRGDRVGRDPARIEQFVAIDAQGEREIGGAAGADPAGRFDVRCAGTTIVVHRSKPAVLYLRAPEFETYLREEGLEHVIAAREQRGESKKMGLEHYSRCAKSLLAVGPAGEGIKDATCDRVVGLPLELVALNDPRKLAGGGKGAKLGKLGKLDVQLLFRGEPVAGVLVAALERERPSEVLSQRSDAEGRVRFELPRSGFWLVKAVHMVEAPEDSRLDWESFWASLTFEVPERT